MGVIKVQGFFVLINEGQGFVIWDKGSLRPIVLIFYSSHQDLERKNSLDLIWGNGSDSVLEESPRHPEATVLTDSPFCRRLSGNGSTWVSLCDGVPELGGAEG